MYRVLPPRPPSWRAVLGAAIVTGIVVVALAQAFAFLAPLVVGAAKVVGSLAAAFVALAWLSFTFQVLLLGASWVRVRTLLEAVGQDLGAPDRPTGAGDAPA
jgi:uncharacterized BrkB/YihY/UPF0761 family membrane protein